MPEDNRQDESNAQDDRFARLLAECDDALVRGEALRGSMDEDPRLAKRLDSALEAISWLESVWPRPRVSVETPLGLLDTVKLPAMELGRYRIIRELGRGGSSVVYLAKDPVLGRDVALKVPRLEMSVKPELGQRFMTEARAVAKLSHSHILPIHDVGQIGDLCFLVLPVCEGQDLSACLKHQGPFDPKRAARLIVPLARAVQHAHDQGILHRDLKPGNVLFDSEGKPLVTDFGLAKIVAESSDLTHTGMMLGTPAYMAPEQVQSVRALGPACDVYALGAILYELLLGKPPFEGANPLEVLDRVRSAAPLPLRASNPALPAALETICLKCLAKKPNDRYASAADLADDLENFLNGRPIKAKPPTMAERLHAWMSDPAWIYRAGVSLQVASIGFILWLAVAFTLLFAGLVKIEKPSSAYLNGAIGLFCFYIPFFFLGRRIVRAPGGKVLLASAALVSIFLSGAIYSLFAGMIFEGIADDNNIATRNFNAMIAIILILELSIVLLGFFAWRQKAKESGM